MSTATFKKIDYSLRPNKNVERKLIAEALQKLQGQFNLPSYRYVGLGAIWFVDFVLFHRTLGIRDMISIQEGRAEARRAAYNRPFRFIQVVEGETTHVIDNLPPSRKPMLIWLDYDSTLSGPVRKDIDLVGGKLNSGDIVLFTVNANYRQIVRQGKGGAKRDARDVLAELLEIPPETVPEHAVEVDGLPPFVAKTLFTRLGSVIRKESGNELRLVPLFNYLYSDQATMLTFGGMAADEQDATRLRTSGIFDLSYVTGEAQLKIDVPLLTHREKMEMDRLLPRDEPLPDAALDRLRCGLSASEVEAYRNFYRHYPTFAELVF